MNADLRLYQGPSVNQQLGLAPQLLQWLRLLQAPTQELASLVQHELETNPALEVDGNTGDTDDAETDDPQCNDDVESGDAPIVDADEGADGNDLNAKLESLAELDEEWREEARVERVRNASDMEVEREVRQAPRGMLDMRFFINAGYTCADGSSLTPESVKNLISELVEKEDSRRPLTDLQIARTLKEQRGLALARRTVAKYREELSISSSKERLIMSPFRGMPAKPAFPALTLPAHVASRPTAVGK